MRWLKSGFLLALFFSSFQAFWLSAFCCLCSTLPSRGCVFRFGAIAWFNLSPELRRRKDSLMFDFRCFFLFTYFPKIKRDLRQIARCPEPSSSSIFASISISFDFDCFSIAFLLYFSPFLMPP